MLCICNSLGQLHNTAAGEVDQVHQPPGGLPGQQDYELLQSGGAGLVVGLVLAQVLPQLAGLHIGQLGVCHHLGLQHIIQLIHQKYNTTHLCLTCNTA